MRCVAVTRKTACIRYSFCLLLADSSAKTFRYLLSKLDENRWLDKKGRLQSYF